MGEEDGMDRSRLLTIEDERLLLCARIVREGTEPFDLGYWYMPRETCGYARCAVGDYCLKAGSELMLSLPHSAPLLPNGLWSWDAVCEHFGLTEYEAYYLFDVDSHHENPTRAEVADRIEAFVETRIAERVAAA